MVKQSPRDHEIVGTKFYFILKNVDLADLKTRRLHVPDISEIDVARDYMTSGRHAPRQSQCDRSVATADFQAAPPWTHSQPGDMSELDGIEQRRHERQALLFAHQLMGQSVFTHCLRVHLELREPASGTVATLRA